MNITDWERGERLQSELLKRAEEAERRVRWLESEIAKCAEVDQTIYYLMSRVFEGDFKHTHPTDALKARPTPEDFK